MLIVLVRYVLPFNMILVKALSLQKNKQLLYSVGPLVIAAERVHFSLNLHMALRFKVIKLNKIKNFGIWTVYVCVYTTDSDIGN